MIKDCFKQEIQRVSDLMDKDVYDLAFMIVTDSHLDDYETDTIQNMQAVDKKISYDFIVHLGDFLTGNFPKKHTARILKEEMNLYRSAVQNGILYPVQGNHDGYCIHAFDRQSFDVVVDEEWYAATDFTKEYPNVTRVENSSYFYADYPEHKLRLVFLNLFSYEWDENGKYRRKNGMSDVQLEWIKEEALNIEAEWTVMIFSHNGPLEHYAQEKLNVEPWNGNKKEIFETVIHAREEKGFAIAGWFIGHLHGELCECVEGIPFIIIGSQTCYVPSLWSMPDKGHFELREEGTVCQDLWDSVTWNRKERTLHLYRFGAGEDRTVAY